MRKCESFSVAALLVLSAFLVSIGAEAQAQNAVEIIDLAFKPDTLTVPVGTAVTWTNDETFDHTVTSDNGAFDSGNIAGGGKFSHTFNQPGNYPYHCSIHTFMHGMIQVTAEAIKMASTKLNVTIVNALEEGEALHVLVANNETTAANLTSWRLMTDNNNSTFTFPVFTLKPKAVVTIHTHKRNNTATDLYGSNFMWNGTHEVKLFDKSGSLVYDYRIGVQPVKSSSKS